MATRGFLIRFIDIGLIVLFGFLMISDIEAVSRVELAGESEPDEEIAQPDEEPVTVTVRVRADGTFLIVERQEVRAADAERLVEVLRALSAAHGEEGRRTLVIIEPHPASAVQRTVDVMDVADRLGLDKSLRMDITVAAADSAGAEPPRDGSGP